jgi:predicted glycoside hydrolase/deacetylase ChbG (UPF0249 family)
MNRARSETPKGVILCADDFCVNQSASLGIIKLAEMGRISATSVMVLSPRWAGDVTRLQDLRACIDVGLHLDWTSDFALASGHGMTLTAIMLKAAFGRIDRAAATAVIEHQLDLFEAHWKAPPDFVDGHQHVQQFAGIRDALVQTLAHRYANQNCRPPYLRISRVPAGMTDLKSRVIAVMGANTIELLAADAGVTCATALLGIYDFAGNEARYGRLMQTWLHAAPVGSIIMCHPAQAAEPDDPIGLARAVEFAFLAGVDFGTMLGAAGVQLVRGGGANTLAAKIEQ